MRAFIIDKYKQPLHEAEVPEPTMGDQDVLVQVAAAGLNPIDETIRLGAFKVILPYKPPVILGHDVAGTVIGVGSQVRGFKPGDEVYARVRDGRMGTFTERVAIDQADVAHAPTTINAVEAASLPLVALTAWQVLVDVAKVTPGQKVLIHGGSGGVGTVAIQLAKHLGAYVATTASGSNLEFVRELGADVAIDYRTQDFSTELSGYDLVVDSLGGENLLKSLRVLRPGGTAVGIYATPTPEVARRMGLNPVLAAVVGSLSRKVRRAAKKLGVTYDFVFMAASGEQLTRIAKLVDDGTIRPVVGQTVPFEQTAQALQALDKASIRGKAVVTVA